MVGTWIEAKLISVGGQVWRWFMLVHLGIRLSKQCFFFWDFFWLFQRNFEIGLPIWCFLTWEIWCLDLFESSTYLVFVHWIPETPETWWNPRIIYHNHNLVNHWINYQSKDKMFLVEFSFCNPNSVRNLSDIIVNIYRGFLEGWTNITLKKGASKMLSMFFFSPFV